MIDPAPRDFWRQVIERVAKMIWERETRTNGAHLVAPEPCLKEAAIPHPEKVSE
jgi:hypothetical protein